MYDLLIRDGLVVDGSGMPAFHADVGIERGKVTEIGRLGGPHEADHRRGRPGGGARVH